MYREVPTKIIKNHFLRRKGLAIYMHELKRLESEIFLNRNDDEDLRPLGDAVIIFSGTITSY